MPRVLHLRTVTGRGGGPEKTLLNSPRFIGPDYELHLAYIRPANDPLYDMPARAERMGAALIDMPERGPLDPRTIALLAKELRCFRPHLLHAHDYKTNLLAVLLGRWFGIPAITTAHGYVTLGGRLDIYYKLDRWALRRMEKVIVVSEDLLDSMIAMGVAPERCVLVENAIDPVENRRRGSTEDAKLQLGIDPDKCVLGAVGRLAPEKGFDLLIKAVDRLLDQQPHLRLLIIGEGPERGHLETLIAELGREREIRLMGYRSDLASLYSAMDLFVLSSHREGLPNVVLEAMAFEVPVVATRVAGVPNLIEHGQSGWLVKPGNLGELTEAIGVLCQAPLQRQELAAAGRVTVETKYSFAVRMSKIRAIYDCVLGRRGVEEPSESSAAHECAA